MEYVLNAKIATLTLVFLTAAFASMYALRERSAEPPQPSTSEGPTQREFRPRTDLDLTSGKAESTPEIAFEASVPPEISPQSATEVSEAGLPGELWAEILSAEGLPFIGPEHVESMDPPPFQPLNPARPLLISKNGAWIGEFELTGRDKLPLEISAEEIPLVRDLALEYVELQDLQDSVLQATILQSRDQHPTIEEANERARELAASSPDDPFGWFVHERRGAFVVCHRQPLMENEEVNRIKGTIEIIVGELGGYERIRVHGLAWTQHP